MPEGGKPGRNERCPCGSGRKSKHCCGGKAAADRARSKPAPVPADAQNALWVADRYLRAGQHEQAIAPLLQAARSMPDHPSVLQTLGRAYALTGRAPEAIVWFRRAIAAQPTFAISHHSLGLALEQTGDFDGALAAHRQAATLAPGMVEAYARIGDLLSRKGRREDAAIAYERAASLSPDSSLGRLCGAKARIATDRSKEAEERLVQLVERDPSSSEAYLLLGLLRNESGQFEQAGADLERSIQLAPRATNAYHALVSSRRLTETDRPVVERIVSRLASKDLSDAQRMTLHFAAGKAFDDLREYATAIGHFDDANRIRSRLSPFDPRYFAQRIDRRIERFTPDFFSRHASLRQPDDRPVFVLGMPRSGTTLIERIVSSHPEVAGGGELPYWNDQGVRWVDADDAKLARDGDGLSRDYVALLARIGPQARRVTDKMPFNFLWIGLIHALLPNARIIHCRRNPIDTCLSIYSTNFAYAWGAASDRSGLASYYRGYLRLMDHWRAVLPPNRLLDVDYEEATSSPETIARRLIVFCGLEWDAACLRPEQNPDAVRTASKWQARQPIYRSSVERWKSYEPWIGELKSLLPNA